MTSNSSQISAEEVKRSLDNKEDVILIDVRTSKEVESGKIPQSIHFPLESIDQEIAQHVQDKNKTIYVYCLSGSRSDVAVDILRNIGYTNSYSMTNGMLMWRFKNYPIEQ